MFCGPGSLSHVFPLQVLSLSHRKCLWSLSSCWLHLLKCPAGNLQPCPWVAWLAAAIAALRARHIVLLWHIPWGSAMAPCLCLEAWLAPESSPDNGCLQYGKMSVLERGWIVALECIKCCSEGGGALTHGCTTEGVFASAAGSFLWVRAERASAGLGALPRAAAWAASIHMLPWVPRCGWPLPRCGREGKRAPSGLFFVLCTPGKGKHDLAPKN